MIRTDSLFAVVGDGPGEEERLPPESVSAGRMAGMGELGVLPCPRMLTAGEAEAEEGEEEGAEPEPEREGIEGEEAEEEESGCETLLTSRMSTISAPLSIGTCSGKSKKVCEKISERIKRRRIGERISDTQNGYVHAWKQGILR